MTYGAPVKRYQISTLQQAIDYANGSYLTAVKALPTGCPQAASAYLALRNWLESQLSMSQGPQTLLVAGSQLAYDFETKLNAADSVCKAQRAGYSAGAASQPSPGEQGGGNGGGGVVPATTGGGIPWWVWGLGIGLGLALLLGKKKKKS